MKGGDSDRSPTRVGDLIEGVLERTGVRTQIRRMSALEDWAAVVGVPVGRVTRPLRVEKAVLFVEVRSSAWLTELNVMKREILSALNRELGEAPIENIVFVLAEDP